VRGHLVRSTITIIKEMLYIEIQIDAVFPELMIPGQFILYRKYYCQVE
jgi:hypothetical protein